MSYEEEYAEKSLEAVCNGENCDEVHSHVHVFVCPTCDAVLVVDYERSEALHPYGQWLPLMYGEITERDICYYCWEHDQERASTLVRFAPDEDETSVRFGDECVHSGDEGEDWFWEVFQGKREYVSTDGWRGHYDTKFPSLQSVFSGWVTGDWGDSTSDGKLDTHRLMAYLKEVEPPVEVFWLFEPTSNLFSTAAEVFVRQCDDDSDLELFKTYLSERFDLDALNNAFA